MPVNSPPVQSDAPIIKPLNLLGALAACGFAISIPLIYFVFSVYSQRESYTTEAVFLARSLEKIVQARPDMWEYESVRLLEIISQPSIQGQPAEREIRTASQKLVVKTAFTEALPRISASATFFDSGRLAGSVIVRHSIRTPLIITAILGILTSFLGYLLYFIFRTHPLRKLEDTLAALRESEEKYRSLASAADWSFVVDGDCRYLYANERYLNNFGLLRDSVLGRKYAEFHHEERSRIFADAVKYVFETGNVFQAEYGGERAAAFFLQTLSPIRNIGGAITAVTVISVDITKRKRAEEALQKSEETAKRLARENDVMAEIGRVIGSTLDIDEVYERFGEKVREIIPFDTITINTINTRDNTRVIRYHSGMNIAGRNIGDVVPLEGTLTERMVRARSSLLLNTKDNDELLRQYPGISLSVAAGIQSRMGVPLISQDEIIGVLLVRSVKPDAYTEEDLRLAERVGSQIAGAIANAQLFLERTRAEEEKRRLEERLQRSERMESLGTLAGGVAHDLNNVLGVLMGYSEMLMEKIPEGNTLRIYVDNIFKSTERGAAIIQDLLTLARRGVSVSKPMNLNDVISSFLKSPMLEQLQAHHPRVTFRTELDKGLLNIKGSPVHLEKTVMNLISNAAEAIAEGGEVTIRTENRYLDKAVRGYDNVDEGEYVVLTVSDNGGGIQADDLGKIFEPFYTKKVMGRSGTGLGLAVVWGTVKDHHGYIDVASDYGKGSTFTLYFPTTREEAGADQQKIPLERYRGRGESVLVVDDVQEQREMAAMMLTELGYQVRTVSRGEEAVEYLKTHKADLMVLDMIMDPGIDGLETYRRVLGINPKQKAVLVSGFSETDRVKTAQELGAGVYIKKPYGSESLKLAVRNELDRSP